MTGRPLDDETEEAMRLCESRMYSLGSLEWNALRDRIRALLSDARRLTIAPEQAKWSAYELAVVWEMYPHVKTREIAELLDRTSLSVYQAANKLGLRKTAEFQQQLLVEEGERLRIVGVRSRFPKGHPPANKGLRRPGWGPGRMKETQFKKGVRQGVAVRLYKPIGTERISKDGYLERKVNDDLPLQRRWRAVHLITWEKGERPTAERIRRLLRERRQDRSPSREPRSHLARRANAPQHDSQPAAGDQRCDHRARPTQKENT
jgi:hypothetical protein